jgi:hypothetical protein
MTTTITTFLTYDTQAEEAATLYTSLFGGKITGTTRYPPGGPREAGMVLSVTFELFGQTYIALNGGSTFTFGQGFSGGARSALDEADGERRQRSPMWLAHRQVRRVLADRSEAARRNALGQGQGKVGPYDASDDGDAEARSRQAEGRIRRRLRTREKGEQT